MFFVSVLCYLPTPLQIDRWERRKEEEQEEQEKGEGGGREREGTAGEDKEGGREEVRMAVH